jgi:prepilin-type N-terminal cleavage/methylation domain-containing protein
MTRYKNKKNNQGGFTLIELLVVVAIIALLSSIALISMLSARQKSRNTKRLGDMTQMNTALELYFNHYKGYPSDADDDGVPDGIAPEFTAFIPKSPTPADGDICSAPYPACGGQDQPNCVEANTYFYVPFGKSYVINGQTVWSDYDYYFCLGSQVGEFSPGIRIVNPKGVK